MGKAIITSLYSCLLLLMINRTHSCSQGKQSVGRFILHRFGVHVIWACWIRGSLHLAPTCCLVSTTTSVPGCGAARDHTAVYTPRSRPRHHIVFLLVTDFSDLSRCMGRHGQVAVLCLRVWVGFLSWYVLTSCKWLWGWDFTSAYFSPWSLLLKPVSIIQSWTRPYSRRRSTVLTHQNEAEEANSTDMQCCLHCLSMDVAGPKQNSPSHAFTCDPATCFFV